MRFEIFKTYPPDRESAVAEIIVRHKGIMDVHAEVFRLAGQLVIRVFPSTDDEVDQYPLEEWLNAIERAVAELGPDAE